MEYHHFWVRLHLVAMQMILRYPGNRAPHLETSLIELVRAYKVQVAEDFSWNDNTSSWDLCILVPAQVESAVQQELQRFQTNFSLEVSLVPVWEINS